MGEIVNLRRVKKTKTRAAANKEAEANRTKHGTPKAVRVAYKAETDRWAHTLDAHKIDKE